MTLIGATAPSPIPPPLGTPRNSPQRPVNIMGSLYAEPLSNFCVLILSVTGHLTQLFWAYKRERKIHPFMPLC